MPLIVVRRLRPEPHWFCLIPGCTAAFAKDEAHAFQMHSYHCSRRHEEELIALSLRHQLPGFFDPEHMGDPELIAWVRAHRDEIAEGRLRMS